MDKEMMKKKLIDKIDTYWYINRLAGEQDDDAKAEITVERFLAFCEVLELMGYDVNWTCCNKSGQQEEKDMTTKEQESKALEQIKKIVAELGEDSYIGTAFEGCFEIAEENIKNDFACSMKQRAESLEKKQ